MREGGTTSRRFTMGFLTNLRHTLPHTWRFALRAVLLTKIVPFAFYALRTTTVRPNVGSHFATHSSTLFERDVLIAILLPVRRFSTSFYETRSTRFLHTKDWEKPALRTKGIILFFSLKK